MNILKRVCNLWKLSKIEIPELVYKTGNVGFSIPTAMKPATIIEPDIIESLKEELKQENV
jgi:hypothetical protein